MWRCAAFLILLPGLAFAGGDGLVGKSASATDPYDYFCTGPSGERYELGEVTCLLANSCQPSWLAKCDMSLNSPMWRKIQDGCPAASLLQRLQRLQPGLYSTPVDAGVANAKS